MALVESSMTLHSKDIDNALREWNIIEWIEDNTNFILYELWDDVVVLAKQWNIQIKVDYVRNFWREDDWWSISDMINFWFEQLNTMQDLFIDKYRYEYFIIED